MNLITRFKTLTRSMFAAEAAAGVGNMPRNAGQEQAWFDDIGLYSGQLPYYNPDDLVIKHGIEKYDEMMTDEQVKSVVRFRRAAITSRSYDFVYGDDAMEQLSAEEQAFRKRVYWAILNGMPGSFVDSLNGVLSAVYRGFSLSEKVLHLIEYDGRTWVGLRKLALRPAGTFELYADAYGNLERLVQRVSGKDIELDPAKFVHYVQNPDVNDLYGQSELRACYRAWFSKDIAIRNQNVFGQRLAGGFVWAEIDENYNLIPGSDEERTFRAAMTNMQTRSNFIMPRGVSLHVEMPKDSAFFENKIAQEDKAIAKALLVPNLLGITEQGNTGSYSQSQTQFEAFMWTLDSEVHKLEEVLNEQLFNQLGDLNFGDSLYPEFTFKPLSQTAKMELAKVWLTLVQGSAVTNGDADEDWLRDLLGAPPRVEEENSADDDKPVQEGLAPTQEDDPTPAAPEGEEIPDDETIIGAETKRVSAMSRAERRVDFAAIDRKADVITYQRTDQLADAMDSAVSTLLEALPEQLDDPKLVAKLTLRPSDQRAVQGIVRAVLRDSWDVGTQQAKLEIGRAERAAAKMGRYTKRVDMARLDELAARYFDAQSFTIAGDLSGQVNRIVQNEVLNGIRYSKSTAEVRTAILERLASAGLISNASAEAAGVALGLKNAQHVLDTATRTASFMSINEARHNFYTDPALNGFVVAYEYSSVLDSRTTTICNELGGAATGKPHVHATDWPGWDRFRPPNHYNCRALLIPITELDDWVESGEPTVEPQEGFA